MKSKSPAAVKASVERHKARTPIHRPEASAPEIAGRTRRRAEEIINAAADLFAERGYHGATTQDIADVLGIRQASLYYYFSSKEAALEIVCLRGVEGFVETGRAISEGPGTAAERLAGLMRSHIAPLLDRGNFVKVFLTQRQFLPNESRRRVGRWSRSLEQIIEKVIREGVADGEFRRDLDPRLTTLALLGMANSVCQWYERENRSIERIGNAFVHLFLAGIAADGRTKKGRR
jgi:AcrR family transcriptional regulator